MLLSLLLLLPFLRIASLFAFDVSNFVFTTCIYFCFLCVLNNQRIQSYTLAVPGQVAKNLRKKKKKAVSHSMCVYVCEVLLQ